METAISFEQDFGQVRINPTIQDRVNEMKIRHAEARADRNAKMLLEATLEVSRLHGELTRVKNMLKHVNELRLKETCFPRLLMLPAPENA